MQETKHGNNEPFVGKIGFHLEIRLYLSYKNMNIKSINLGKILKFDLVFLLLIYTRWTNY